MPRSLSSNNQWRILFAALITFCLLLCTAGQASAQKGKGRKPARTQQTTGNGNTATTQAAAPQPAKKNLAALRTGESPEGGRATITSDAPLNDYEAYRSGNRYYVVIPQASAPSSVAGNARARGFDDVQVHKRGNDTVLSFRLKPGTTAHVNQKFNRLEVVFNAPGDSTSGSQSGTANTSNTSAGTTGATTGAGNTNQRPGSATGAATTGQPNANTSPNATATPMVVPGANTAVTNNGLTGTPPTAAASPGPTVDTTLPPVTPVLGPTGENTANVAGSPTPPTDQVAQAHPAPSAPTSVVTTTQPATSSGSSLGAVLRTNWLPILIAALVLVGIGLFIATRSRSRREATATATESERRISDKETTAALAEAKPESANVVAPGAATVAGGLAAAGAIERETKTEPVIAATALDETETVQAAAPEAFDVERVRLEIKHVLTGEPYDETVINSPVPEARQLIESELLFALSKRHTERRNRALKAFTEHGYFDDVTRELRTATVAVERAQAARKLGLARDTASTPHLVAALEDPAPEVRRAAVEALTEVQDAEAVAPLEGLLKREEDRKVPHALIQRAIRASSVRAVEAEETSPAAPVAEGATEQPVIEEAAATAEALPVSVEESAAPVAEAVAVEPEGASAIAESLASTTDAPATVEDETPTLEAEPATRAEETEAAPVDASSELSAGAIALAPAIVAGLATAEADAAERRRVEADAARIHSEQEARRAEEERQRAEEESALRRVEEAARLRAEAETQRLAEEERRREEEQRRAEAERLRVEEERRRAEAEERRLEEERRAEAERLRLEEEQRQEEQRRVEEERRQAEERQRLEAERLRVEEERRAEEERQRAEAEQQREQERLRAEEARRLEEEEQRRAEAERVRLEEERARVEEEQRLAEEERLRVEAERQREEAEAAKLRAREDERRAEEERVRAEEEERRHAAEEKERQEEEARRRLVAEEQERIEEARRQRAEERERRRAEEERARLEAGERERSEADAARRRAEDAAMRLAEMRRRMEEEARQREAAEAERLRLEEEERQRAEEEAARLQAAEEEAAALQQEEERQAEEERLRVEAEARQAEEEERLRAEQERRVEEEQRRTEEDARRFAEEERKRVEAEARQREEAEAARIQYEQEAAARRLREEAEAAPVEAEVSAPLYAETTSPTAQADLFEAPFVEPEQTVPAAEMSREIEAVEATPDWIEVDITETEAELDAQPDRGLAPVVVDEAVVAQEAVAEEEAVPVKVVDEYPADAAVREVEPSVTERGIAQADEDYSSVPGGILRRLGSESADERAAAVSDLARVGGDDAFREISAAFDDPSSRVRDAAARALFDLHDDHAASFTRALREAPPERRRKIGNALASSGLASQAIGHLMGESREKTYDAFSLLFLMSKAGEVQPLMRAIEEHPNSEVRLAVVKLLALSGQQEILPAFRRLAVRGSLPTEVRSAVMEAIYQISSQASTDTSPVA